MLGFLNYVMASRKKQQIGLNLKTIVGFVFNWWAGEDKAFKIIRKLQRFFIIVQMTFQFRYEQVVFFLISSLQFAEFEYEISDFSLHLIWNNKKRWWLWLRVRWMYIIRPTFLFFKLLEIIGFLYELVLKHSQHSKQFLLEIYQRYVNILILMTFQSHLKKKILVKIIKVKYFIWIYILVKDGWLGSQPLLPSERTIRNL